MPARRAFRSFAPGVEEEKPMARAKLLALILLLHGAFAEVPLLAQQTDPALRSAYYGEARVALGRGRAQ